MTLDNPMTHDIGGPRLNYDQYQQVQLMYRERPKYVVPPKQKPSIEAPTKVEGSRFDARG